MLSWGPPTSKNMGEKIQELNVKHKISKKHKELKFFMHIKTAIYLYYILVKSSTLTKRATGHHSTLLLK